MQNCIKNLFAFVIVCYPACLMAQQNMQSLGVLAAKTLDDTSKINKLIKLSASYLDRKDTARARNYGEKALALTEKIKWNKGLVKSYLALGQVAKVEKNYSISIDYHKRSIQMLDQAQAYGVVGDKSYVEKEYTQSLAILSEKDHPVTLFEALIQGKLYQEANNAGKAIDCYLAAKKIADKTNSIDAKEICSYYLSEMYSGLHENDKAISYALDAWQYFGKENRIEDTYWELLLLNRITESYTLSKSFDNALQFGNKALLVAEKLKSAEMITHLETSMAWAWYSIGNFTAAYGLAKQINVSNVPEANKLHNYNTLGCIIRDAPVSLLPQFGVNTEDRYKVALDYFMLSMKNKSQSALRNNYLDISITYERLNKPAEALTAYKNYMALKDSTNIEEIQKMALKKEIQFDFNKKEDSLTYTQQITDEKLKQQSLLAKQRQQALQLNLQKLSLANKQKDIEQLKYLKSQANLKADANWRNANLQQLRASQKDKALAQATVLLQKTEIRSRRSQGYYFLAGLIAVFLLSVFIGLNYYNQRRSNKLLSDANQQITVANKELADQQEEITCQRDRLSDTIHDLKSAQNQLIHSEKMASLGELTAGIAHEIQNPLNFVNNFSDVNREMVLELKEVLLGGNIEEALAIAGDIEQNEGKINLHGKRAEGIVKGMLEHSRTGSGEKQATDINKLADEFLKLSYHAIKAKDKQFNAEIITHFNDNMPRVNVMQQDIGRVLLNVYNNAFYAMQQKQKSAGPDYKPTLEISAGTKNGFVEIYVRDNGGGIPDNVKEKIMQPFFTTKPTGHGTGLGLSLSYDIIVKGHNGHLTATSEEGQFTQFKISIPV